MTIDTDDIDPAVESSRYKAHRVTRPVHPWLNHQSMMDVMILAHYLYKIESPRDPLYKIWRYLIVCS